MKTDKTSKAKTSRTAAKISDTPVERKRNVRGTTMIVSTAPVETPQAAPASQREITSELIAARAYNLWEQQGRPHGRDVANWLLAESQLKQETQSFGA
jgi:hypothetical protein